ncbi:MAG: GcvT family protein [Deltaproteobacteria bacterium]|nr:GcvT family protein [Deltaproteobacteria bacterium]
MSQQPNASQPKSGSSIPRSARVVIVGGGVIGCSTAYHLAKRGWSDVVLLERHRLTSGTTWHAAGLVVTSGFTTSTGMKIAQYTRDLYATLEQETGFATGFNPVGLLQIAANREILEDLRRKATFGRMMGIDTQELSPAEIGEHWPLANLDDVLAGFFTADDGRANPVDLTISLSKGAQARGVRIVEGVEVVGIDQVAGRVTGVVTDHGSIEAEYVINCAGMWARQVGEMAGVSCPLQAAEHYYVILDGVEGMHRQLPVLEDPSVYGYFREEGSGLMVGLFEPVAAPWSLDGIPDNFSFGVLEPDLDRMIPYLQNALERIPSAKEATVRQFFCGPESFTPDLSPLIGEAPELRNFFVAAGLNSLGILQGGGIGRLIANWIVDGLPDLDVAELHIDRFQPYQANRAYRKDRTSEIVGEMYKVHFPNESYETARNVKRHVLHDRLESAGAFFVQSAGWEIADWYAPKGQKAEVERYTWQRQNWFEYAAEEHRACREDVILMDMSFMSKFVVQGRDALAALERVSCNALDVPNGRIVYTQWTNAAGGIEADLTITRRSEKEFLVVCSDTVHRHVETWMRRHFPEDGHVTITDVTSAYAMLTIQGPRSRSLLSELTTASLANEDFPYLTSQEIDIGYARVEATRVTYLGELGWELYVPTEHAMEVYDRLLEVGPEHGLRHAGLEALGSLRLEKAYRDFGHDIGNLDTPYEAGLGFAVALEKPNGFIGRDALAVQKKAGVPNRRLVQFLLEDPEPLMYHGEVIWRDDVAVGSIRAGAFGHTLGASVGLGYVEPGEPVTRDYIATGTWEIEIAGVRHATRASLRPLYDPKGERIRS